MKRAVLLAITVFLYSCGEKPEFIYTNGKIYTLDDKNTIVEAIAVNQGKIIDMGTSKDITDKYSSDNVIEIVFSLPSREILKDMVSPILCLFFILF